MWVSAVLRASFCASAYTAVGYSIKAQAKTHVRVFSPFPGVNELPNAASSCCYAHALKHKHTPMVVTHTHTHTHKHTHTNEPPLLSAVIPKVGSEQSSCPSRYQSVPVHLYRPVATAVAIFTVSSTTWQSPAPSHTPGCISLFSHALSLSQPLVIQLNGGGQQMKRFH